MGVADIDRFVFLTAGEAPDALDEIGDVGEAACLGAIALDSERFTAEGLTAEGRDDAAVIEAHAGTVGIEDADDFGIDAMEAVIGHGHGLGEAFGFVVDAARADGVDVAPVCFGLGMDEGVAVDFASGGEQEDGAFGFGEAESVVGAEGADLEGRDRHFEVIDGAGRRGEMEDVIDRAVDGDVIGDIVPDEGVVGVVCEVGDVLE